MDPDRYAPLDETHRKVAEDAEKRRAAEAERIAARTQGGQYNALRDTQRQLDEQAQNRAAAPEPEPVNSDKQAEARMAARQKELEEKVRLGRITTGEMAREMFILDRVLLGEGMARDQQRARDEQAASRQQDRGGDDPSRTGRDSASDEHEPAGQPEISDARAERKARLRAISDRIERERRENEGKGLDLARDAGGRSR